MSVPQSTYRKWAPPTVLMSTHFDHTTDEVPAHTGEHIGRGLAIKGWAEVQRPRTTVVIGGGIMQGRRV